MCRLEYFDHNIWFCGKFGMYLLIRKKYLLIWNGMPKTTVKGLKETDEWWGLELDDQNMDSLGIKILEV